MIDTNQASEVLQGDCLELMKDIPDGSVDMIPVFTGAKLNESAGRSTGKTSKMLYQVDTGLGLTGVKYINADSEDEAIEKAKDILFDEDNKLKEDK